jgi:hypothetical protein
MWATVVDVDHRLVRDDVAGDAARETDGVEPLPIDEAVDLDLARNVRCERVQDGRDLVDRVVTDPAACGVRAESECADLDAQIAVAAPLDP